MNAAEDTRAPTNGATAHMPYRRSTRGRISQRVLYAQMREDPLVDLEALSPERGDRVLCVASGGCTALTLLAEGPAEVVAVDQNPAQLVLVELKLAALRALPLAECRRFLGVWPCQGRRALYRRVAPLLSDSARAYWDQRDELIEGGLLYAGSTEALCRRWMPRLLRHIHAPRLFEELLACESLEEQRHLYTQRWNTPRWRRGLGVAFHPLLIRLVYGARFRERFGDGDLVATFASRLERGFTAFPARENYFLSQLLQGRFPPREAGLPPYLRPDTAARIRRFAPRLRLVNQDLTTHLEQSAQRYDKITLSNAFEWLTPAELERAFTALEGAIAPGGAAVLRHLLATSALPSGSALVEAPESASLTARERAFLYERVSLYRHGQQQGI